MIWGSIVWVYRYLVQGKSRVSLSVFWWLSSKHDSFWWRKLWMTLWLFLTSSEVQHLEAPLGLLFRCPVSTTWRLSAETAIPLKKETRQATTEKTQQWGGLKAGIWAHATWGQRVIIRGRLVIKPIMAKISPVLLTMATLEELQEEVVGGLHTLNRDHLRFS